LSLLAVAVGAFLLGGLPLGWLALKRLRGLDARWYAHHNLGLRGWLRSVGPVPGLVQIGIDLAKGFLITGAGHLVTGTQLGAAVAGVAAYLGHLWPVAVHTGDTFKLRGRGTSMYLGVAAGILVWAARPAWPVLAVAALAVLLILLTRYAALGKAAALIALPVIVLVAGEPPVLVGLVALASLAGLWRWKENLGRVLDGTEPTVDEMTPLPGDPDGPRAAAFMIHPMDPEDWFQAGRFRWLRGAWRRGLVPRGLAYWIAARIRPMKTGVVRGITAPDGREVLLYLIGCPLLPEQIKAYPRLAERRAIQAAQLTRELGAEILGLGAFWSTVGRKGEAVQEAVPETRVTNGGAYTAGSVKVGLARALAKVREAGVEPAAATAAVVGANGVVAFGCCRVIAPDFRRVIMIGRDPVRLERSAETLRRAYPETTFETSTDLHSAGDAEVVFTATSEPTPVLYNEHLRKGAWVYDLGRPYDVAREVYLSGHALVIPGGVVRPPGQLLSRVDLHFGPGMVPACLAETLILAMTGEWQRASIGGSTRTEDIMYFISKAAELGFEVMDDPFPAAGPEVVAGPARLGRSASGSPSAGG
jgi:predicted amino acid dehydrogenase